jgi:acetyl-CoA acetyltransferase
MRFEKSDEDIVCVSAVRTPFGRFGGSMRDIDIYDLGALIMKEAMERIHIDPALIGEVWWGYNQYKRSLHTGRGQTKPPQGGDPRGNTFRLF